MYDNFKTADDEELAHKLKHNWTVISQHNNCVRRYEYDKQRFAVDADGKITGRIVRSQAFVFSHNGKPAYVLQVWPVYRPLVFPIKVYNQRREKNGMPPLDTDTLSKLSKHNHAPKGKNNI